MAINFLDFSVSPPQEGVLAVADVADIPDGSIVLYPSGTGDEQEMTVAQLLGVYNGTWTPTVTNVQVNEDPTVAVGTLHLLASIFTGGPHAVAFQIHFLHIPATGVIETGYHFDVTFPDTIGDISDYYAEVKYSSINTSSSIMLLGTESGGFLGSSTQSPTPPFRHGRVLTFFSSGERTAFQKFGTVNGTFIL